MVRDQHTRRARDAGGSKGHEGVEMRRSRSSRSGRGGAVRFRGLDFAQPLTDGLVHVRQRLKAGPDQLHLEDVSTVQGGWSHIPLPPCGELPAPHDLSSCAPARSRTASDLQ